MDAAARRQRTAGQRLLYGFLRNFRRPAEWLIPIILLITLKAVLYLWLTPERLGEHDVYLKYSERMLADRSWLYTVDVREPGDYSTALKKMIGPSLIFAAARGVAGDAWPWLVSGLFNLLTAITALLVWKVARAHGVPDRLALLGVVLVMLGVSLTSDITFWADSLYGNLFSISICLYLLRPSSVKRIFVSGIVMALSALSRASVAAFLPAAALLVALHSFWRGSRPLRAVLAAAVFALPGFTVATVYKTWNAYRTGGEAVMTTNASTGLLTPLFLIYDQHPEIFDDPSDIERTARQVTYPGNSAYGRAQKTEYELVHGIGYTHVEAAKAATALFRKVAMEHPALVLEATLKRLISGVKFAVSNVIGPLARIDEIHHYRHLTEDRLMATASSQNGIASLWGIGGWLALQVERLAGAAGLGLAVWFALRRGPLFRSRSSEREKDATLLLLFFACWLIMHAPVGMEPRYLLPVAFALPLALVLTLEEVLAHLSGLDHSTTLILPRRETRS